MDKIRTLKADEIECRIGSISERDGRATGLSLLLYKDARCDMAILDEVFGPFNWQRKHSRDNANCKVGIYDDEKKEWIWKEDTGTESNTEKEKGLASDSFKRACFNWGIGRELYTAPFIFIKPNKCTIRPKSGGRGFCCYDSFKVERIGYNDNREIVDLKIVNTTFKGPNDKAVHTICVFEFKNGKMVWSNQDDYEEPVETPAPLLDQTPATQDDINKIRHELSLYCNRKQLVLARVWEQYGIDRDTPFDIFKAKFDMIKRDYGA